MKEAKQLKLGDKAKDRVSGFSGIITGESKYLYGCEYFEITSPKRHDEKPIEGQWFDTQRCVAVTKRAPRSGGIIRYGGGGPSSGSHGPTRSRS